MTRRALLKVLIASLFGVSAPGSAKEGEWAWVRVETGIPSPVVMRGVGVTKMEESGQLVVRLSDPEGVISDFEVRIRRSGSAVTAEFEPPNTQRHRVQLRGLVRESRFGPSEMFEEMIFAEPRSSDFLFLSRRRSKQTPASEARK